MPQNGVVSLAAPGTLTAEFGGVPIASVVLQATGTGSGMAFTAQGLPAPGGTAVALPMYPLASGVVGSPVTSGSANGVWIIPSAGFVSVTLSLTEIASGTEAFSLNSSTAQWPF